MFPSPYTLVTLTDDQAVVADYPVQILELMAYPCNGGRTVAPGAKRNTPQGEADNVP